MIEVNQKFAIVLLALAMSAILMIVGSFIGWMHDCDRMSTANRHYNWKWMCVFTLSAIAVLMLAEG